MSDADVTSGGIPTMDIAEPAGVLRETAEHHDRLEKVAPPHDWSDWYTPDMKAPQQGSTPDEASQAADRCVAEVRHVLPL